MTDGARQAYVMVPTAEHVFVLVQQPGHNLALLVARAALTGRLVQFLDMWWDDPSPQGRPLTRTSRRVS